jgi:polyisoprenoid-binding protein YceI
MEEGALTGGSFSIDMATLVCEDLSGEYKGKLEGHLKSDDFFGVANNPTADFTITSSIAQGPGKYKIVGDLTIKGITKEIKFPATVTEENGVYTAVADITVDRSEYDVKYGSGSFFDGLGDKVIYDEFNLAVSLSVSK